MPTTPKPQTSKEVIAENIKLLIEQLEAGHSEGLTAYLTAMGRFHNYSFGNILEIARQKPDATRVAGLYAWNQLGRKVMKGQKGIRILAPMIGSRRKKDTEAERSKDPAAVNTPVLVGFRAVYVFDVSQTEGAELPQFTERTTGEVGEYRERLIDFTTAQGIELEFKDSIAPALGMSYGGTIAILPGQAPAEEFSTLVHELAHELLHKAERSTATTKTVRETEAEAIAFVVSQTIGLDAGRASADYIHLYHGNAALLTESLEDHPANLRPHPLRHRDPRSRTAIGHGRRRTRRPGSRVLRSGRPAARAGEAGRDRFELRGTERVLPRPGSKARLTLPAASGCRVPRPLHPSQKRHYTEESHRAEQQRIPVHRHRHHPRVRHQPPPHLR